MKRQTPSRQVLAFSMLMSMTALVVLAARARTLNLLLAALAGIFLAHLQVSQGNPFRRNMAFPRVAVLAVFAVLVPMFGPLLVSGGVLAIFSILRLLDGSWFRTPRASFLLCLVMLLLGLQLRQDALVAVWILLFITGATGFLAGAERELMKIGEGGPVPLSSRHVRHYFLRSIRLLLVALPLFFLIPRFGFHLYLFHGSGIPAFNGRGISLDSLEDIRQSNDVVMRVFVSAPVNEYYRARSFNIYSPRSQRWYSMPNRHRRLQGGEEGVEIPDLRNVSKHSGEIELEQEYILSPALAGSFFGIHRVRWTDFSQGGYDFDDLDNLTPLSMRVGSLRYKVKSQIRVGYPPGLDKVRPPPDGPAVLAYLQVPRQLWRLKALAHRVAGELETSLERALAIENHLRTEYEYSLLLSDAYSRLGDVDPIEGFLFKVKKGHCELFASAMVLMLRSVGVAARLTEGFGPGEYQPDGDYFVLRGRNAHAWVEAYFPGFGWFRFDPTGFRDADTEGGSGWLAPLRRTMERVNFIFDTWVSGYSQEGLRGMVIRALEISADMAEALAANAPRGYLARVAYWTGVSFVINFAFLSIWLLLFDRHRISGLALESTIARKILAQNPRLRRLVGFADDDFYQFFLTRLTRLGVHRPPGRTPRQFACEEVRTQRPELEELAAELADYHDRLVYAPAPDASVLTRQAWQVLARFNPGDLKSGGKAADSNE